MTTVATQSNLLTSNDIHALTRQPRCCKLRKDQLTVKYYIFKCCAAKGSLYDFTINKRMLSYYDTSVNIFQIYRE